MLKKIQEFGHSFAGFGGQFENFHAWANGLDVAQSLIQFVRSVRASSLTELASSATLCPESSPGG